MTNSISIDVEDYYHARNIELAIGRSRWSSLPSRVNYSTKLCLDLLSRNSVQGTFFVLGSVARRDKQLIKDISSAGHEIASHGFRHHLAYEQSPKSFLKDVCCSRKLLQDISGQEVEGYRAPNFSIRDQNLWSYNSLIEAGFKYDSSLYPVYHPRYDNRNKPLDIHYIERENGKLVIVPLAVLPFNFFGKNFRLGIAGGAYWRLFPHKLIDWGLKRIRHLGGGSGVCYLHPWELDSGQPVFDELKFLQKLRHYGGISKLENRIDTHLKNFSWQTISQLVQDFEASETKL